MQVSSLKNFYFKKNMLKNNINYILKYYLQT